MASPSRRSPRDLGVELEQDASQFGFFQAVRLLGLAARKAPGRQGALPAKLRFRTLASLSFPPSELRSYRDPARRATEHSARDVGIDEMEVSFMGLTGPNGALPVAYTEMLIERKLRQRDSTAHAFFDIFSHRAIALFYAAWRKYRYWISVESGEQDGFSRNILDLSGLGLEQLRGQMSPDQVLDENLFIYYAGLLSQKPLSAQNLAAVAQGVFGTQVTLEQFVGQWIALPPKEQTRIGQQGCELGLSAFVGQRVWDRQTKLRMRLGPMSARQFTAMQAGASGAQALSALLQYALGHSLAVDINLVLDRHETPPPVIRQDGDLRLGGNAWLDSRAPRAQDPDDMVYSLLQ